MPTTPPLSVQITDKLQSRNQAVKWTAILKEIREFRAYCCNIDSDAIMGVAKEPVPIVDISPTTVCLGASITWDISNSYAPGSTLTAWSIDFGDSSSDSGADFPNDTTSGTHTYASVGSFTVTVTLTEGTGRTQTSTVEINVIQCGVPGGIVDYAGLWTYVATDGSGVYFIDWAEDSPDWVAKNGGLTGDALTVRSLVIKPGTKHLPEINHELWIATLGGIYKSTDGGISWAKLILPDPSNLEFEDSPAATVDELDWHHIVFDPADETIVYILASKEV